MNMNKSSRQQPLTSILLWREKHVFDGAGPGSQEGLFPCSPLKLLVRCQAASFCKAPAQWLQQMKYIENSFFMIEKLRVDKQQ